METTSLVWDLFHRWETAERALEGEFGDPTGHTPELDAMIRAMRERVFEAFGERRRNESD